MKQTTKDWLIIAEDDLLAAKKLANEERLSNLVSFHCQQCIEKCFKAVIEGQLWEKYDDLHIDEIDSDFNNKKLHSIFIQPVIKFMNLL